MLKITQELIEASVKECFETMAYMELNPCSKNIMDLNSLTKGVAGQIDFNGRVSGIIKIYSTKKLMECSTINMLGMGEDEISEKMCQDTLLEFLNIITGTLLRKLEEGNQIAKLGLPQFIGNQSTSLKTFGSTNELAEFSYFRESDLEGCCLIFEPQNC